MIEYLKNYNLTDDDIKDIKKEFNNEIISKFEIMEDNVKKVLNYLQSLEINNYKELILNRPDLFFVNVDDLKDKVSKFDQKLIKYIFENEVDNLINFNI